MNAIIDSYFCLTDQEHLQDPTYQFTPESDLVLQMYAFHKRFYQQEDDFELQYFSNLVFEALECNKPDLIPEDRSLMFNEPVRTREQQQLEKLQEQLRK